MLLTSHIHNPINTAIIKKYLSLVTIPTAADKTEHINKTNNASLANTNPPAQFSWAQRL